MPFGLRDGHLWFVSEVATGLACGCRCPDPTCDQPLIARNKPSPDRQRAYHFMHATQSDACGGRESALHRMAKDIVLGATALSLPAWRVDDEEITPGVLAIEGASAVEVRLLEGRTRPDLRVAGVSSGVPLDPLYVEVRVTHAVDWEKAALIRSHRLSMFEIDLSAVTDAQLVDAATFTQLVLHDMTNRSWIHLANPAFLSAHLGQEIIEVRTVETQQKNVPFRSGEGHLIFNVQSIVSHVAGRDPWETAIELESFVGPDAGPLLDRHGTPVPYAPGLYFRGRSQSSFKDVLVPMASRVQFKAPGTQQGALFGSI